MALTNLGYSNAKAFPNVSKLTGLFEVINIGKKLYNVPVAMILAETHLV